MSDWSIAQSLNCIIMQLLHKLFGSPKGVFGIQSKQHPFVPKSTHENRVLLQTNTQRSHLGVILLDPPLCLPAVLPGWYVLRTYLIPPSVTLKILANRALDFPSAFSLKISSLSCGERRLDDMRDSLNNTGDACGANEAMACRS